MCVQITETHGRRHSNHSETVRCARSLFRNCHDRVLDRVRRGNCAEEKVVLEWSKPDGTRCETLSNLLGLNGCEDCADSHHNGDIHLFIAYDQMALKRSTNDPRRKANTREEDKKSPLFFEKKLQTLQTDSHLATDRPICRTICMRFAST